MCASGGMVDTLALGASALRREGSSPFSRTKLKRRSADRRFNLFFYFLILVT